MNDEACKNENLFRVWSVEDKAYCEGQFDFYMTPYGTLCWCDDYGDMHKADPTQYEIVIERGLMASDGD